MILRGSLPSAVLGMDTGITVITPGSYHLEENCKKDSPSDSAPYKTAYLLHGLYGNHANWADNTMLPSYANDYGMIFIMPEAARSYYTDMAYGLNYFTYISQELPALCRKFFRVSHKQEDTYVIGGSVGGYGALKCGLSRPDMFGRVMAFSSAGLFMKDDLKALKEIRRQMDVPSVNAGENAEKKRGNEEKVLRRFKDMKAAFGENLECPPKDDLLFLAESAVKNGRDFPEIHMICGKDDPYLEENRRFSQKLAKLNPAFFSYQEISGCHDWDFFNAALKIGLEKWGKTVDIFCE